MVAAAAVQLALALGGSLAAPPSPPPLPPFRLPSILASNMLLQRGKPVEVWGWAPAGATVSVSLGGQRNSTQATANGTFSVGLPAQPAALNRTLTVSSGGGGSGGTLTLTNVAFGDLFFCSGQSNSAPAPRLCALLLPCPPPGRWGCGH